MPTLNLFDSKDRLVGSVKLTDYLVTENELYVTRAAQFPFNAMFGESYDVVRVEAEVFGDVFTLDLEHAATLVRNRSLGLNAGYPFKPR